MKRQKVAMLLTLVGVLFSSTQVFAAAPQPANSTNQIEFTTNDNPTDPVDPTDPDNPNPPVDPTNPPTGNNGPLSIDSVPNIDFGINSIETKTVTYNAKNETPFVQITDKRGSGAGWDLSATITEFKTAQGDVLKGAELSFSNGQVKTVSSNTSNAPTAQDLIFANTASQPVMAAAKDDGQGTWIDVWSGTKDNNSNVQLKVPVGSAKESVYTATITWTLSEGPVTP